MTCPDCGNTLKTAEYLGVKIDECDACGGKWFDRDELKQAIDRKDNYLRWLDFNVFEDVKDKYESVEGNKLCPRCQVKLISKIYSESRVVIGVCQTCGGVWLENKEFQKIIRYLEHIVLTESAKGYEKDAIKQFEEIFTGPQSRISEIKDFIAVVKLFELRLAVENPWAVKLSQFVDDVGLSVGV